MYIEAGNVTQISTVLLNTRQHKSIGRSKHINMDFMCVCKQLKGMHTLIRLYIDSRCQFLAILTTNSTAIIT